MAGRLDFDVVIVGAGPCGVTTANLLGQYGVRTLVIDQSPTILNIPRAIGVCNEGSRVLERAGLANYTRSALKDIHCVNVNKPDGSLLMKLNSSVLNGYLSQRTFYQPELEQYLRDALNKYHHVVLRTATECLQFDDYGDHVSVRIHEQGAAPEQLNCRYLLACDGARSPIRKQLGVEFVGSTYSEDWVVVDVAKDPAPSNEIDVFANTDRPGLTLPAPGGKRRWEFVIKKGECNEVMSSYEKIAELLSPWGNVEDMQLERRAVYTFNARVADQFKVGNVFLMGDAAHVTPPFAGQGMMAGLRDAYNLAWKLAFVIQGRMDHRVLNSYESERKPQVKQIVNTAKMLGGVILPQGIASGLLRDLALKRMAGGKKEKRAEGRRIAKIANHINGSRFPMLIKRIFKKNGHKLGIEFPQNQVINNQRQTVLIDDELSNDFYIMGYGVNPAEWLSSENLRQWRQLGGKFCSIQHDFDQFKVSPSQSPTGYQILFDFQRKYSGLFAGGKLAIVVRPDRMMVVVAEKAHINGELGCYLTGILPQSSADKSRVVSRGSGLVY